MSAPFAEARSPDKRIMSIYTEDLTKVYGTARALDGVSISVDQGEMLGVVGSSGSGKSTLGTSRCWNDPPAGRVVLDGQDLTALSECELRSTRRGLGNVFPAANLLDNRSARANGVIGGGERPRHSLWRPLVRRTGAVGDGAVADCAGADLSGRGRLLRPQDRPPGEARRR
jgi:ABC-type phosphate/phosphonate transport system ATPase subunit